MTHRRGADTRSVAMNVVTADSRPDGTAARRSHRRRRGQVMSEVATRAGAAEPAPTAVAAVAARAARTATAVRARSARTGMTRLAAIASRMTSTTYPAAHR